MSSLQKQKFEVLVKENKGNSLEKIISQILSSNIYITSDFLSFPNVIELGKNNKSYNTLFLFSNLTYLDYVKDKSKYIDLTPQMIKKLKMVSILEYAKTNKSLDYSFLKEKLNIKENFELEELLFEIISNDLINGKVDMIKQKVNIISIKPRNNLSNVNDAKKEIEKWLKNIEVASKYIDEQEIKLQNDNEKYKNLIEKA
jgi:hypothetical protein